MEKKLTERQKQALATKLKISEISISLMKSKGFEAVSIQDICKAGNVSVGAFYHHFKSKKEIINTAYKKIDLQLKKEFEFKNYNSNVEKIVFLLEEGASQVEKFGVEFVREVYKNLISADDQYTFSDERFTNREIKSLLIDAVKSGELKTDLDADIFRDTIMRITRGVIFDWCMRHGEYTLKERVHFDLNLLFKNITY